MPQHIQVRSAGERVENLIAELHVAPDPRIAAAAEELVRTLVDLYGEGLAHVMRIVAASDEAADAPASPVPIMITSRLRLLAGFTSLTCPL